MNVFEYLLPIDSRFDLVRQEIQTTRIHFYFHSKSKSAHCPKCQKLSTHRHSHTKRKVRDLPISGKEVFLHLQLQKWFCRNEKCDTFIFTEIVDAAPAYQRNTVRVKACLREMAFRTNCLQAEKLSEKMGLPTSHDTLLRLLYDTPHSPKTSPFLAIDDFAFRKGETYGTIVCDLITHRPIALLNGRDQSTVTHWLKEQPKVYVVARDGSTVYKAAIASASSDILQVSDRFHLVQNLMKTTKEALTHLLPNYIEVSEELDEHSQRVKPITDPPSLSKKEEEKWAFIQEVKQAHQLGSSQRAIAKKYQISRSTVKKYIELEKPLFHYQEARISTIIQPFYKLVTEFTLNGKAATAIYQEMKSLGFTGSYSIVLKTVNQLKSKHLSANSLIQKTPRKKVIYYFCKPLECLNDKQKHVLELALSRYPKTQPVYEFIQNFREVYSTLNLKRFLQLLSFFEQEETKEIKRYLRVIKKDIEAVKESFLYTFNTSIVEGQINRLKMLKRLMYGRGSIELLEKRVLFAG